VDLNPTQDAVDLVREFAGLLRSGKWTPIRVDHIGADTVHNHRTMREIFEGGSWQDLASGETGDDVSLLAAATAAAASNGPLSCFPLIEVWMAQRLRGRIASSGGQWPDGLVLADVSGALGLGSRDWPWGAEADALVSLAPGQDGQFVVEWRRPAATDWSPSNALDVTLPWHRLTGVTEVELGPELPAEDAAVLGAELLVLEAAEILGCADSLLHETIDYVSTRYQFGKPISAFQAVSHRVADMFAKVETLRSFVEYSAWAVSSHPDLALEFALMAKGLAGRHAWEVSDEAFQLHGAMGFTWEMGLQHRATRIVSRALAAPTSDQCLSRAGRYLYDRGQMVQLLD
jgi:hypothetical protein